MILEQRVNCRNKAVTHTSKNLLVKVLDQKVTSQLNIALVKESNSIKLDLNSLTRSGWDLFKDCVQECQEVFLGSIFPQGFFYGLKNTLKQSCLKLRLKFRLRLTQGRVGRYQAYLHPVTFDCAFPDSTKTCIKVSSAKCIAILLLSS